jgi:1-acyl-sn-glycerol-3-phosphate acyltransferase
MALGALAANPDCDVKIVPCGMNYFHAHKFRSRAVVEFGPPIEVPPELVQMYKDGQRREAVGTLLDTIYQALLAVTVTSPDYETLMVRLNILRDLTFQFSDSCESLSKLRDDCIIQRGRSSPCQWSWNSTVG